MNRVHVVLHRPIYPRNIGMCARAIGNMGAGRLIIVGREEPIGDKSKQGAAHAQDILRNATFYKTVDAFYEREPDGIRIALSGKDARLKVPDLMPNLLHHELSRQDHRLHVQTEPIYLFFGTEDDGLSAKEMELCHFICRLPTFTEINSLNLSHAVLLALYILRTALSEVGQDSPPTAHARSIEMSQSVSDAKYPQRLIKEWLELLGFSLDSPRINIEKNLNRILLGHAPTADELRTLSNILSQTVRRLKASED